nr:MAG TPA: hypothetical protein [Caudoviricetes sp.]
MKHFAYKIKNSNDRDCVAYIDSTKYKNQITNYPVGVEGSCYSCSIDMHTKLQLILLLNMKAIYIKLSNNQDIF